MINLNFSNYTKICQSKIPELDNLIRGKKLDEAIKESQQFIDELKFILNERIWSEASEIDYNNILILAITFKAFKDYAELGKITVKKEWELNNSNLETVWTKLWDCRDRLDYVKDNSESSIIGDIYKNLDRLLGEYKKHFGDGLYASPEILIKKEHCSICKADIRACNHIKGYGYSGVICYGIPQDFEMTTVSLVEVPKDPRCRMWPWRRKEKMVFEMAILTMFQIDDFLKDEV